MAGGKWLGSSLRQPNMPLPRQSWLSSRHKHYGENHQQTHGQHIVHMTLQNVTAACINKSMVIHLRRYCHQSSVNGEYNYDLLRQEKK